MPLRCSIIDRIDRAAIVAGAQVVPADGINAVIDEMDRAVAKDRSKVSGMGGAEDQAAVPAGHQVRLRRLVGAGAAPVAAYFAEANPLI